MLKHFSISLIANFAGGRTRQNNPFFLEISYKLNKDDQKEVEARTGNQASRDHLERSGEGYSGVQRGVQQK